MTNANPRGGSMQPEKRDLGSLTQEEIDRARKLAQLLPEGEPEKTMYEAIFDPDRKPLDLLKPNPLFSAQIPDTQRYDAGRLETLAGAAQAFATETDPGVIACFGMPIAENPLTLRDMIRNVEAYIVTSLQRYGLKVPTKWNPTKYKN